MPAASRCASAAIAPPAVSPRASAGLAAARAATFAAALGRRLATAVLGDDIDIISLLHDVVLAQLEPAIADELAGLEIVFVAVPRTHEVHLAVGEIEPARRLVGHDL